MFCSRCGQKISDGAKFCPGCGNKIGDMLSFRETERDTKLVAAKCTNCGASLSVDPGKDAAICPYCNTPYIVDKAIQNFQIHNTYIGTQINVQGADVHNLVKIAEMDIKAGKYSEALKDANRALESEPSNIQAWVVKIKAAGHDIEGDRSSEITSYIEAALDTAVSNEEQEESIYAAVFDVSIIHIEAAKRLIESNQEALVRQAKDHRNKNDIAAMDSGYVMKVSQVINEAIEYRSIIPDRLCINSAILQEKAKRLLEMYNSYYDALTARYQINGGSPSAKTQTRRKDHLQKLMIGVPSPANNNRRHGFLNKIFG